MNLEKSFLIATAGLAALVVAVAALGAGALALERRAHDRLDAALQEPLAALLPDGQVADVDGRDYEVTVSADLEDGEDGPTVLLQVGALTRDGARLGLTEAPAAVRTALAPVSLAVPDPRADAEARRVWFDEQGVGVETYARDASVRRA